jgi:hypothetical protein
VDITLRGYTWTDQDMINYKDMRSLEDIEMIATIDDSVKAAMEALGDDLQRYLQEAGENIEKPAPEEKKKITGPPNQTLIDPFVSIFKGIGEFGSFVGIGGSDSKKKISAQDEYTISVEKSKAKGNLKGALWNTYKNFKKAHKMVTW